jgi:hypothetical protein
MTRTCTLPSAFNRCHNHYQQYMRGTAHGALLYKLMWLCLHGQVIHGIQNELPFDQLQLLASRFAFDVASVAALKQGNRRMHHRARAWLGTCINSPSCSTATEQGLVPASSASMYCSFCLSHGFQVSSADICETYAYNLL